jgi:hypothetical protein
VRQRIAVVWARLYLARCRAALTRCRAAVARCCQAHVTRAAGEAQQGWAKGVDAQVRRAPRGQTTASWRRRPHDVASFLRQPPGALRVAALPLAGHTHTHSLRAPAAAARKRPSALTPDAARVSARSARQADNGRVRAVECPDWRGLQAAGWVMLDVRPPEEVARVRRARRRTRRADMRRREYIPQALCAAAAGHSAHVPRVRLSLTRASRQRQRPVTRRWP